MSACSGHTRVPRSPSSAPRPSSDLPNCDVVGRMPIDQVDPTTITPSVFCMPTRREAYGIVFLEALAHALPVVATKLKPIRELVSDGQTGYLVDVGGVDALPRG